MTIPDQDLAGRDAGLNAVRAALAVTPSPDFVARVRQRVRQEPVGAFWNWWPRLAVAAATIAVGVIVGVAWWSGQVAPEHVRHAKAVPVRSPTAAMRQPGAAEPVAGPSRLPDGSRSRSSAASRSARSAVRNVRAASEEHHDILVAGEERRALDRLLLAMRQGRAAVPAPRQVLEDENGRLLPPRPIEIPLVRPIEPLPGMAVDRSGSKER